MQNGSPGTLDTSGPANARSGSQNDAVLLELHALRRSEAVLRDFIETSTISLHWVGADGTILWANQAELDLLGYTREEYIGRNIAEFHSDQTVIKEILACLSWGDALRDYPARLRHRDGSIRHVLINSSVLFENGKFVHTRCFTRDITALRQEQEIREEQTRIDGRRLDRPASHQKRQSWRYPPQVHRGPDRQLGVPSRASGLSTKRKMCWSLKPAPD